MAESIASPKINVQVNGTLTNTLDDSTGGSIIHPSCSVSPTLNNGIDAAQCNRGWQRRSITIVQNAQETLSLYDLVGVNIGAGAGRDGLGQLITYEEIVAIVIFNENAVTVAGSLEVLPANSEGWTPIGSHTVANGGALQGQGGIVKYQTAGIGFEINRGNEDLIVNGDFGTGDLSGWTTDVSGGTGTVTIVGGACQLVGGDAKAGIAQTAGIALVIGQTYVLTADTTGSDVEYITDNGAVSGVWSVGSNSLTFTATSASDNTGFEVAIGDTATIDNIQIREELGHRITFRAVGGDVSYSMYLLARHDEDESSSSSSSSSSLSSVSASSQSTSSSSISTSSDSSSSSSNSSSSLSSQSSQS